MLMSWYPFWGRIAILVSVNLDSFTHAHVSCTCGVDWCATSPYAVLQHNGEHLACVLLPQAHIYDTCNAIKAVAPHLSFPRHPGFSEECVGSETKDC